MLHVEGGNVFDFAKRGYSVFDFGCECGRGEHGEGAGSEADCLFHQTVILPKIASTLEEGIRVTIPTVPLPPIFMRPNRLNGAENVVIFSVTFRITITSDGFEGINLDDIVAEDTMESRKCLGAKHTGLEICSWYANWQLFRHK